MLNHVQRCLMLTASPEFTVRNADMWQQITIPYTASRHPMTKIVVSQIDKRCK